MPGYRLTKQSEQDLHGIWAYIARDNSGAADKFLEALFETFSRLSEYPHIGQQREILTSQPLRFFPVGNYLIAYRPDIKPLEIYRVLSDYRDMAQELN